MVTSFQIYKKNRLYNVKNNWRENMKKLDFTKEKLELFLITELLICKSYNNSNVIKETAEYISKSFCKFYKFISDNQEYKAMYDFAKESTEYMNRLSAITGMYSTLEQFLKVSLNPSNDYKKSLEEKIESVCEKYKYSRRIIPIMIYITNIE